MSFKFENLEVWKLARSFITEVYKISQRFPKTETFGLTNQLRRAAVSVALNIAEGSNRRSNADFKQFLQMGRASLDEVVTALYIAKDQDFIPQEDLERIYQNANTLAAKITALAKKL